jgi:MerR family transcriptional regulator/heat shock protein HspR
MSEEGLPVDDPDYPLYTMAQATEALGINAPTLRRWEQHGLITPRRTGGGQRRYSRRELERLRQVAELAVDGVTPAGIRKVLNLQRRIDQLEDELAAAQAEQPSPATPPDTAEPAGTDGEHDQPRPSG